MQIDDDGIVRIEMTNKDRTGARVEMIAPGEGERAAALLSAEQLVIVENLWTPEVVAAWAAANPDYKPEPLAEPEPPTTTDRLTAVEDALLELMLTGGTG